MPRHLHVFWRSSATRECGHFQSCSPSHSICSTHQSARLAVTPLGPLALSRSIIQDVTSLKRISIVCRCNPSPPSPPYPGDFSPEQEEAEDAASSLHDDKVHEPEDEKEDVIDADHERVFDCLLDLFIFGDGFETRQFRNDVMTALDQYCEEHGYIPNLPVVIKAFDSLPESSTFCQYLIEMSALLWRPEKDVPLQKELYESLPPHFVLQVMLINSNRANGARGKRSKGERKTLISPEDLKKPCRFHEHTNKAGKGFCKRRREVDQVFIHSLLASCVAAAEQMTGN